MEYSYLQLLLNSTYIKNDDNIDFSLVEQIDKKLDSLKLDSEQMRKIWIKVDDKEVPCPNCNNKEELDYE